MASLPIYGKKPYKSLSLSLEPVDGLSWMDGGPYSVIFCSNYDPGMTLT